MKNTLVFLLFIVLGTVAFGQKQTSKYEEILIHTSAECDECKARLESTLNYTKGIRFAELDLNSRNLTIKYKKSDISPEQIRKLISSLGYQADSVEADPEAYNKLPACCKVGGMGGHTEH